MRSWVTNISLGEGAFLVLTSEPATKFRTPGFIMRTEATASRPMLPSASWAAVLALACAASLGPEGRAQGPLAAETETCTLEPGLVKTVARVVDAETVQLDDGSEVRLIGALAPRARDANAAPGSWPAEQDAIAALSELVLGRSVKLAFGGRHTDRYGRHVAQLFVERDGNSQWVQGALLANGHARVYGLPENFACGRELLAHERIARENRLGIWRVALYRPKPSALAGQLMGLRSSFQIVDGRVASVSRTKSAVYLNFGSDWKSDFTIRIGKPALSGNTEWAAALDGLKDKDVSVRGWIERRNGPLIEVFDPSQLEIQGETVAPPVAAAPNDAGPEADPKPASGPDTTGDAAASPPAPTQAAPPRPSRHKQKRPEPRAPGAVNL